MKLNHIFIYLVVLPHYTMVYLLDYIQIINIVALTLGHQTDGWKNHSIGSKISHVFSRYCLEETKIRKHYCCEWFDWPHVSAILQTKKHKDCSIHQFDWGNLFHCTITYWQHWLSQIKGTIIVQLVYSHQFLKCKNVLFSFHIICNTALIRSNNILIRIIMKNQN